MYTEIGQDKTVSQIISRLKTAPASSLSEDKSGGAVKVEGTWGSFARLLAVKILKQIGRPVLYVSPHIDDADNAADDLQTFGAGAVEMFPAWEGQEDLADATDEIRAERLRIVLKLLSGSSNFVISTSVQALCQPIPKRQAVAAGYLKLNVGGKLSPDDVVKWLVDSGFENVDGIDLPGQFARRGGIVDVYAPLTAAKILSEENPKEISPQQAEAIRIEFFGDVIESIRQIDLDTHRSGQQIKSISIVSATSGSTRQDRDLFLNILPAETIIIFEEIGGIEEVAGVFLERAEDSARLYNWQEIYSSAGKFAQLHISRFGISAEDFLKVDVKSVQQFQHKTTAVWASGKEALEELVQQTKAGKTVYLYCEADAEIKRVTEIITQSSGTLPENFKLLRGFIHQGFMPESLNLIVISHHELFGQQMLRRRQRPIRSVLPIDTLADLQKGDYVVHLSYGIGKYLGAETIPGKDSQGEYLTIEYAGGVKAHVSVINIALVQKYIGTSPKRPKLNKIGSKKWQRQKEKVAKSVKDLAGELLEIQARRRAVGGFVFGPDSSWQMEFEQSFPYQETADQTAVIEHIKADMRQPVAMDRLLCGDVGYGKTELAMRAAFKAVENGKQAAVLVPTTVLCVQHGRTFTERFADFPVCIEVLNRFKTPVQAADIIERTKQGKVDILIGTHRLLSGDVGFKDLGLLIIDEEQRFGVEHKEKLKRLRVDVDVLTMTATPIPRTLNMAMLGLRDISSLATPPLDRRSIVTAVAAYNPELTRKAIIQELNRQGQVFFVHNRIKTIEKRAWEIQRLVSGTGAKISVAHGRMAKSELEKAMIDFVVGRTEVLVCTTIIESGLDIPNANTIFIDDADRFGLAELHQLRGRVGRYKHRAYAYILLPKSRPITPIAARRLKAIEEYSHLGAGFRIALRDLEIRGAGNILGAEQSGHIQAVGYQMYCELLAEAVKRLKNEPVEPIPTANIDLGFAAYIPKNYIPSDRHRMEVYRKIAVARNEDDVRQIEDELADVYGPIPEEVKMALNFAELRIKAGRLNIRNIGVSEQDLVFSFAEKRDVQKPGRLFAKTAGKVIVLDPNTVHLRLNKNYFEPQTLVSFLKKILSSERH